MLFVKHTGFTEITITLHPAHADKLADTLQALLSNGLNDSQEYCPNEYLIENLRTELFEILNK